MPGSGWRHFNPHTREGCDDTSDAYQGMEISISIHTPVKGVTGEVGLHGRVHHISIHTPVKGVTRKASTSMGFFLFQSTHP